MARGRVPSNLRGVRRCAIRRDFVTSREATLTRGSREEYQVSSHAVDAASGRRNIFLER